MSDITRTLNDLIATCYDSEEGFGKAAKGVHDDHREVSVSLHEVGVA